MKRRKAESGKTQTGKRAKLFVSAFRVSDNCAFTLIELMTVIVLIGLLTAMILPEMRGTYEDALLRTTSRDLVSVFELASSRAISLNQQHRVRLDTHEGRYLIERKIRMNGAEDFVPLKDVSGGEGELDKRVSIEIHRADANQVAGTSEENPEQTETISFYPDGTADAATVLLRDREGFRLALRLNPITSRVNILEMERE